MPRLRTLATPLTIGSFLTLGVTGLCLLAGYRQGLVTPLHELSSLVFVAASILHIAVNWKPTLAHLKRPLGAALALLFLGLTAFALVSVDHPGSEPRRVFGQAADTLLDSNLQGLAAVTRRPEQELRQDLTQAGFGVIDPSATLRDIARTNRKDSMAALAAVLPAQPTR